MARTPFGGPVAFAPAPRGGFFPPGVPPASSAVALLSSRPPALAVFFTDVPLTSPKEAASFFRGVPPALSGMVAPPGLWVAAPRPRASALLGPSSSPSAAPLRPRPPLQLSKTFGSSVFPSRFCLFAMATAPVFDFPPSPSP
jgi:hypothetical protein